MAGHAARRISIGLAFLLAASFANAQWGSTHYCRLSEDQLVLFAAGQRFVLKHAAAWELVDPQQKDAFDKWLTQAKLTKDLGQLVSSAPIDHAYPLAGEVDEVEGSDSTTALSFKIGNGEPKAVKLTSTTDGARPDSDGAAQFSAVAKSFGKSPSTLLVLMSDATGQISDTKAWGLFLNHLHAKPELFTFLDKKQGILWIRRSSSSTIIDKSATRTNGQNNQSNPIPAKREAAKSDKTSTFVYNLDGVDIFVAAACLVCGVGTGYWFGLRGRKKQNIAPGSPPQGGAPVKSGDHAPFIFSVRERKLIESVRVEIERLGWPADHVPSADEFVIKELVDRYRKFEVLQNQVDSLQSYKKFSEDHDSFQRKIDDAVIAAQSSEAKAADLSRDLQQQRAQLRTLSDKLTTVQSERDSTVSNLNEANKIIDDLTQWSAYIGERLDKLTEQMQNE